MKGGNLIIGIYFHPEAYPPTLNAVNELSDCFNRITLIHRPHLQGTWKYPGNVTAVPAGDIMSSLEQQNASLTKKIKIFLDFLSVFYSHCVVEKPSWILVYDSMSLFAYYLLRRLFTFKHKVWYHNHDVTEMQLLRKYSIGWFAAQAEMKTFLKLHVFSLPTNDRLKYFPMEKFKGRFFFIPNYPSKHFFQQYYTPRIVEKSVRIIFQGQVGPWHGIEEILPLLKTSISNYYPELVLKGPCMDEYKAHIIDMADKLGVKDKVKFLGLTPYAKVPEASSRCHIGIGILAKKDIMNMTLGTASNKLYEYAALGLPVIYYNSEYFTRYLNKFVWAVPVDLDSRSIEKAIRLILNSYTELSLAAHQDFLDSLNFENGFKEVKSFLEKEMAISSRE